MRLRRYYKSTPFFYLKAIIIIYKQQCSNQKKIKQPHVLKHMSIISTWKNNNIGIVESIDNPSRSVQDITRLFFYKKLYF